MTRTPNTSIHLIAVNEHADTLIRATGAALLVRISGQSFFTGNEAFKKAAEVTACVEALKERGIDSDDISIAHVSMEVENGLLTKSSSATYYLSVRCRSVEILGPVLAAIGLRKQASIGGLEWRFGELENSRAGLLETAVASAKATACSIAEALGTECVAVHRLTYTFGGIDTGGNNPGRMGAVSSSARRRKSNVEALERLNLEHTRMLSVDVSAEFVVAPFAGEVRTPTQPSMKSGE